MGLFPAFLLVSRQFQIRPAALKARLVFPSTMPRQPSSRRAIHAMTATQRRWHMSGTVR
jgi:hypothetical protein